jgi:ornithine carbamoyltransferase
LFVLLSLRTSLLWFRGSRNEKAMSSGSSPQHILTIADVGSRADFEHILQLARAIKADLPAFSQALKQQTLLMLFQKPSLRTRVSFETGMTDLGGHAIFYDIATSPLGVKETYEDTGAVLSRLSDCVMARVNSAQSLKNLAQFSTIPIINGLDDWAHPCQMLADFLTILEKKGTLAGLTMGYFGDTRNNVTYDLARACAMLGLNFRMAGPKADEYAVHAEVLGECDRLRSDPNTTTVWTHDAAEAIAGCDVIYTDSWMSYGIEKERAEARRAALQPYQVNDALMKQAKPDAIFMNCLPAMRGNEQTASVIDGPQSVVFDEAENRKWAQMALLLVLLHPDKYARGKFNFAAAGNKRVVVALGGNALAMAGEEATYENCQKHAGIAARSLADLVDAGYELVITHGNGPQVGAILLQNQTAADVAPPMPLPVCGAQSQGYLGLVISQAVSHELRSRGKPAKVSTVLTQTLVSADDPAFKTPTKPVGKYYTAQEAEALRAKGEALAEDASGRGFRVVVASPMPQGFVEAEAIQTLVDQGYVVIAGGGGGVPVVRDDSNGMLSGVAAVVDKDRSAVLLAEAVGADTLIILTDVDQAQTNFNKPDAARLAKVSAGQVRTHVDAGEFGKGSMEPKMIACAEFVERGAGRRAIVTSLSNALRAVQEPDAVGTHVVDS